jgi:hypothetical protein
MQPKTALSLAALAFGATLVASPALAQNSAGDPGQSIGTAQPQQQRQAVPLWGARMEHRDDVQRSTQYQPPAAGRVVIIVLRRR